jgi:hypothetical protein
MNCEVKAIRLLQSFIGNDEDYNFIIKYSLISV